MAVIKTDKAHKFWLIRRFPSEIKDSFKEKCEENKQEMVMVLKKLLRGYVNETADLEKGRKTISISKCNYEPKKDWGISSFPIKLKADFKSCCASRGDTLIDAIIHLTKGYVNG